MEERWKKKEPFKNLTEFSDAERNLIVEWYSWAMTYANNEANRRAKKHDRIPEYIIFDAATSALLHTAKHWNPKMGTFKTYFHCTFRGFLSNEIKVYCVERDRIVSENTETLRNVGQLPFDEDVPRICTSEAYSIESFEDQLISKLDIENLLSKLTPLQARIVFNVCIQGDRQADVARELGVSRQNVGQTLSLASRALRRIMDGEIDRVRRGRRRHAVS